MDEKIKTAAAIALIGNVAIVSVSPVGLCGTRDFCAVEGPHEAHAPERDPGPARTVPIKDVAPFTLALTGAGYGTRT